MIPHPRSLAEQVSKEADQEKIETIVEKVHGISSKKVAPGVGRTFSLASRP